MALFLLNIEIEVQGTEDAYKGVELKYIHNFPKDTT